MNSLEFSVVTGLASALTVFAFSVPVLKNLEECHRREILILIPYRDLIAALQLINMYTFSRCTLIKV